MTGGEKELQLNGPTGTITHTVGGGSSNNQITFDQNLVQAWPFGKEKSG